MKTAILIITSLILTLNSTGQELVEVESLPKEVIGSHILKMKIVGSKVEETPKNKKVFCKINNSEIKLKNKTMKIERISQFTQNEKTLYFLYFEREKNFWIITKGQKVQHAIMEQNPDTNETKVIYGVDKK